MQTERFMESLETSISYLMDALLEVDQDADPKLHDGLEEAHDRLSAIQESVRESRKRAY